MLQGKVRRIIAEQLNAVEECISNHDRFVEDLQVNDIEMQQIILALEDEFELSIEEIEKGNFKTINDIANFLKDKGIENYPRFEGLLKERFDVANLQDISNPLKKMYLDFAMSTISRGEDAKRIVSSYVDIADKRYLDVGCAYGGFLVAFSNGKAKQAVGIDISEYLLDYSKALITDCDIRAQVYKKDILDEKDIAELGKFDIITCNDVIEHVDIPKNALENMASLLEDQGLLFMQIPNRLSANFIKSDGHFQLFGITVLPKNLADEYYNQLNPGKKHDVTYKSLNYYIDNLNKSGLVCEVLQPFVLDMDKKLEQISNMLNECVEICGSDKLSMISEDLKREINNRILGLCELYQRQYREYLSLSNVDIEYAQGIAYDLVMTFGTDFWTVIARK